jgi:DNA (cytosine-5)-methyltransferase 1
MCAIARQRTEGNLVGFIGGPPCPDFSVAGRNRGHKGTNGRLTQVYVQLVCEFQPDIFFFENVKGLWQTKTHRAFYDSLIRQLNESGYIVEDHLCNAIEYGTPQNRERVILWGIHANLARDLGLPIQPHVGRFVPGAFSWAQHAVFPGRTAFEYKWPSKDAFAEDSILVAPDDIPLQLTVEHWFRQNRVVSHANAVAQFKPKAQTVRFTSIDEGDTDGKSFKRLHRWRFSPTAAYGHNEVHLHPYKARRISVAEALAIQSVPAEFELPDSLSLSDMFKCVSNGVPFLAAEAIASSLLQFVQRL